jgi:uncharacterized membrane protein (DUF485 family)
MKINFKRVVLGGLIAGIILNLGETLLNEVFLVKQMEETARRLHIERPGTLFIGLAILLTLVIGVTIVLLYALIKVRLGAGIKSAVLAGLIVWFPVYVYTGILTGVAIALRPLLIVIAIGWGLVEYLAAAIIGSAFYKEA